MYEYAVQNVVLTKLKKNFLLNLSVLINLMFKIHCKSVAWNTVKSKTKENKQTIDTNGVHPDRISDHERTNSVEIRECTTLLDS